MESCNLVQMLSSSFSSSSSSSSSPLIPFVGIAVLILIYVVILYLVLSLLNEDYRLYSSTASSIDGISGLSLEKIRKLPWFDCERAMAAICAVCLDGFLKGERCRNFPGCKHVFHAQCIDPWLLRRITCPTCLSIYY